MKKILVLLTILVLAMFSGCTFEQREQAAEPQVQAPSQINLAADLPAFTIGYVGPLTGDVASIGVPMKETVEMVVNDLNVNGGINGRMLHVIYEDGRCNSKDAVNAAQKLMNVNKVEVIIGGTCSPEVLGMAPMAEQVGVVMISPSATNPSIKESGDYVFRVVPSDNGQAKETADLLTESDFKRVAVLYINNDWGVGLKNAFESSFEGDIVATENFDVDGADFKTQLSKIKAMKPDVLYMMSFPKQAGIIIKQAMELGLDVPIYAADGAKDDSIIPFVESLDQDFFVILPGVPDSPELEKFAASYFEEFGKAYNAYTPESYDVANIVIQALENTDGSADAVKDYLYSMGEFKGVSGTFEFDLFGEVDKPYDVFTVENGKFVKVRASGNLITGMVGFDGIFSFFKGIFS